nr:PBSX family phage terminase large subunit [Actinopolyspora halophila]
MMDLDQVTGILSPKQIKSIVECQRARISVWTGAVRSGKTLSSLLALLFGIADAPSHGLVLIVGRTLQTIERNTLDPLQDPELFGSIAGQVQHTRGSTTATILGRTVHLVGASDARAEGRIRGVTACLAYVDEATLLPEGFWTQLLARLSVPGARVLATTNPDSPAHWLRTKFLLRSRELDLAQWHFTLDDNPSLQPEYVASLKAEYVGLWYRRFIEGEWIAAEGAVYDMWNPARHVVTELPPIRQTLAVGVDYGTRNPFAAVQLAVTDDRRLVVTREWRHDPSISRRQLTDADFSRELRQWLGAERPRWLVVDPSAASFKLQLFHDGQSNVMDARNDVVDGIRQVSSLLATDRLVVHESAEGLITEFPGYAWDDAAAEKGEDRPIKAADHSLDALRYAIASTEFMWRPMIR